MIEVTESEGVVEQVIPVQLQWWFEEVLNQLDKAFLESSMEALKERRISPSDEDELRFMKIERYTERRRNRYVQNVVVAMSLVCVSAKELALSCFSTTASISVF